MAGRRSRADSTRPAVTLTASLEPGREGGGGACAGAGVFPNCSDAPSTPSWSS